MTSLVPPLRICLYLHVAMWLGAWCKAFRVTADNEDVSNCLWLELSSSQNLTGSFGLFGQPVSV